MTIKTPNIYKKKTSQKSPSERRLSGVPPIMPIKTPEKKRVKIEPQKYILQGFPLQCL